MSNATTESARLDAFLGTKPRRPSVTAIAFIFPLFVGAAVFLSAWFGIELTRSAGRIAAIWLSNAIMVGAVLSRPANEAFRILAVGFVANVAANFVVGDPLGMSLVLPLLNQVEVVICTKVLDRFRNEDDRIDLTRPRVLTIFCLLALGPAPLIAAALAAAYLSHSGMIAFSETFSVWYRADVLGLLTLTPVLLNLRLEEFRRLIEEKRVSSVVGVLLVYSIVLIAVFGQIGAPLLLFLFPFAVLVAFQAGFAGVIIAVGLTAAVSVVATLNGHGPMMLIRGDLRDRVLLLQVFLAVLAMTLFQIAAALAERDRFRAAIIDAKDSAKCAQRERAESEARYRLIAERVRDVIIQMTLDGTLTYLSPSAKLVTGYSHDELLGTSTWDYIHPADQPGVSKAIGDLVNAGPQAASPRLEYRFRHKQGPWIWIEVNPRCLFDETDKAIGFIDIVRDVTARKLSDEELKLARAEAEAASKAKTDFLASMSHEIRTPLNGIIGYADLMLEDKTLRADQRSHLERIEMSGAALLAVVDDVLDFSRIEAGKVSLNPQPFEIAALVDESISIVRTLADKKGLELRVVVAEAIPAILVGDEARLRQVVLNLLNNAIKFTLTGRILLTVDRERGPTDHDIALRFTVEDTGVGIASSRLDRLFKRFSQADDSITRSFGGSGLGLAISRNLVELMGGSIGVESCEGTGSTFWFTVTLPRAGAEASSLKDAGTRSTFKARILLVEDMEMNQALAIAVLEAAGHSVAVVPDGADAIMAIQEEGDQYDVVLMDLQMPGTDGVTAARRIRALDHPSRTIPIIAMTANVLPKQIAQMRAAGMVDHVGKPFRRDRLYAAIERAMQGRRKAFVPQAEELPGAPFEQGTFDKVAELVGAVRTLQLLTHLTKMIGDFQATLGQTGERSRMAQGAHKLVSASGSLGFAELSRLCRDLEQAQTGTGSGDVSALLLPVRRAASDALERIETLCGRKTAAEERAGAA